MKYNLFALVGFVVCCAFLFATRGKKIEATLVKALAAALVLYKAAYYVKKNLTVEFCPPIEISAQSYFLVPLFCLFGGKRCRSVAAFFGVLCGMGFFLGYGVAGFYLCTKLPADAFLTAVICHGILLVVGVSLCRREPVMEGGSGTLGAVMLGMCLWATAFYDAEGADLFFWRVLRPAFLFPATEPWQIIGVLGYYVALATAFYSIVRLFALLSGAIYKKYGAGDCKDSPLSKIEGKK